MAGRIVGVIAALLIFLGVVAITDLKSETPVTAEQPETLPRQVVAEPQVHLTAIAGWDDAPLYMPRNAPAGWELTFIGILPAAETKEGCDQVEIDYEDPADEDNGFLYLYEFPRKCAKPMQGGKPFATGPYRGSIRHSDAEGSVVQITVDATTVQATSDLNTAELQLVLQELVPLDAGALSGVQP